MLEIAGFILLGVFILAMMPFWLPLLMQIVLVVALVVIAGVIFVAGLEPKNELSDRPTPAGWTVCELENGVEKDCGRSDGIGN